PELPVELEGEVHRGVRLLLPQALAFSAHGLDRVELSLRRDRWTGRGRIAELQMSQSGGAVSPAVGVQAHALTMTNTEIGGGVSLYRGASLLRVTGAVAWADVDGGATALEAQGAVLLDDPALRELAVPQVPALDDLKGAVALQARWTAPSGVGAVSQTLHVE